MISTRRIRHLLASVSMVALLGACAVQPMPLSEADMKAQAAADTKEMYPAEAPLTKPLTLSDAIARALTFNLDRRTKMMEEALAIGQKDVERWDMLPKLAANAGYTSRSEANATRSRDAITNVTSTSNPTYSSDRDNVTADLGLTWNILDLGVSYVSAHQTADKALIANERRRKTVHNLIQEVRFAYWRTAAAQVLETEVLETVAVAEAALVDARAVEKEGLKSPAEILRYQKNLLENLRQLEAISQELSTAKIELAALINQPPGSEIRLDIPADATMTLPVAIPTDQMEELAFVNNPDLREQVYLSRIAVDETKKTILKLLPGINLNTTRNWDSNSFLVDNQWYSLGAKLSWNLFNLISAPDQISQAEAGEKVANAKRVALRMAVLAQVHVSHRQFQNAGKQYLRADELYQVEQRLAQFSRVRAENDAQSVMERIANQTSAIAARLRRYQSYAQMESAYGKMQATLGQDLLPEQIASRDLETVSAVIAQRIEAWSRGSMTAVSVAGTDSSEPEAVPAATPVAGTEAPRLEAEAETAPVAKIEAIRPEPEALPEIAPVTEVAATPAVEPVVVLIKPRVAAAKPRARSAVGTSQVAKAEPGESTPVQTASLPVVTAPAVEWRRAEVSEAKWAEIMDKAAKLRASTAEGQAAEIRQQNVPATLASSAN